MMLLVIGFILGCIFLAFSNFIIQTYNDWQARRAAPFKPQATVHFTDKTPQQVIDEAKSGCFGNIATWLCLGAVAFVSPEIVRFLQFLVRVLQAAE
ncbi:MAG: hypothetical protein AAF639_17405 [Chloroflexota bacterium]